jgi:hypothetical protein
MLRNACEAQTGIIFYNQVVKTPALMHSLKYFGEHSSVDGNPTIGETTAEPLRAAEAAFGRPTDVGPGEDEPLRFACGDAWFGSVMTCVELWKRLKVHSTWIVKGNTRLFPKKQLLAILRARHNYARGNWVVMSTEVAGVKIMVIAYAWSVKGVSFFVTTCGDTNPGEPYLAAFEDDDGLVGTAVLPRPAVCSFVYRLLPQIDEHNRQRQHFYDMSSAWPTPCPWFRLLTAVLGMCMVDLFYLLRHMLPEKYDNMGIMTFADRVCASLTERNRNAPSRTPVNVLPLVSLREIDARHAEQGGEEARVKRLKGDGESTRFNPQRTCRVCIDYYKAQVVSGYGCATCEVPLCKEDRSHAQYDDARAVSCQAEHARTCTGIPSQRSKRKDTTSEDSRSRLDQYPWKGRRRSSGEGAAGAAAGSQ